MVSFRDRLLSCQPAPLPREPTLGSADRLPDNLLGDIITMSAANDGLGGVLQLLKASRLLRQVATLTPSVWAHIRSYNPLEWVPEQLALSKQSPLTVIFRFSQREVDSPFSELYETEEEMNAIFGSVANFLQHRARIQELRISITSESEGLAESFASMSSALVNLLEASEWRALSLAEFTFHNADETWALKLNKLFGGAAVTLPHLTSLAIRGIDIAKADWAHMPCLQELRLECIPANLRLDLEDVLNILRRFPTVENLEINYASPVLSKQVLNFPPVSLPCLQYFSMAEHSPPSQEEHDLKLEVACAQLLKHIIPPATFEYSAEFPVFAGLGPNGGYVIPIPDNLEHLQGRCVLAICIPTPKNVVLSLAIASDSDGKSVANDLGAGEGETAIDVALHRYSFGDIYAAHSTSNKCDCAFTLRSRQPFFLRLERDNTDSPHESPFTVSNELTRLLNDSFFSSSTDILKPRLPLSLLCKLRLGGDVAAPQRAFWAHLFEAASGLEAIAVAGNKLVKSVVFAFYNDEVDWEYEEEEGKDRGTPTTRNCASPGDRALLNRGIPHLGTTSKTTTNGRPSHEQPRRVRSAAQHLSVSLVYIEWREYSVDQLQVPLMSDDSEWVLFTGNAARHLNVPVDTTGKELRNANADTTSMLSAWEMFGKWVEGREARGCKIRHLPV